MHQITDQLATHGLDWSPESVNNDITARGWHIFDIRGMLYDEPKNTLEDYELCIDGIISELRKGKKVCISCSAGMSRSNAVAIGVLVKAGGMNFFQAYNFVHAKVPISEIEPCHILALKKLLHVEKPFSSKR